ncbi:hypothetical protein AB1Y20_003798 [Prymnesium parvum]|uniref:GOST seven transmembrane domain-containing protein n=1 Tax=Prymnesium parvum TaxID=97485 RepID=A0AB34J827_PRYPA
MGLRLLYTLATLTSTGSEGNVYQYQDQLLPPNVVQYRRVGMWAGTPATRSGGGGSSSISIDLKFRRPDVRRAGVIQVLVFNSDHLTSVGTPASGASAADGSGDRSFCCTPSLKAQGVKGCDRVGRIILLPDEVKGDGHVWVREVLFGSNQSAGEVSARVPIHRSGVHYLLLASCELHTGQVYFTGQTSWLNPYGYLPGELYYFLPFFRIMAVAYLTLGIVWGVQCWRHWSQLLPLQMCIAGVIMLGLLETSTWHLDYISFNGGGSRDLLPVVIAVSISTVRKTVSRLLVLAVCLGYGVVRPTLGSVAQKILALGVVYTVFSAALDVASNISQISELSVPVRLIFIAPVALLDALFYWWTFSGLTRTLAQLSTRRQSAKLLLYQRFSYVLLTSIAISGLWVCWQMLAIVANDLDERWASLWIFDAFWHVLYFGILIAICWLWSPNKNNLQYAYMDELGQCEDEEDDGEEIEGASTSSSIS